MTKTIITSVVLLFGLSAYLWASRPSEYGRFEIKTGDSVKKVNVTPHYITITDKDDVNLHNYENEDVRYKLFNPHNRPTYLEKSQLQPVALFDTVEENEIIDGHYLSVIDGFGYSIEIEKNEYRGLIFSVEYKFFYFEVGEIEKDNSFIFLRKRKPYFPCPENKMRDAGLLYLQGEDTFTMLFSDGNSTTMKKQEFSIWKVLDLVNEKRFNFRCL